MAKITILKDGRFTTKVFVGYDPLGKPVQKRVSASTKTELNHLIAQAKKTYQEEVVKKASMTLFNAYEYYISQREGILSKGTIRGYRAYQKETFQSLMHMHIDTITKDMVQKEVNKLVKTGSPKTIRNKYGLLNAVLREYREQGGFNIKLPMKKKPMLHIPTEEEVNDLLEMVKDSQMELPIMFAALCGMRRGEIFALSWKDIDLEKGKVYVTKALGLNENAKFEVKSPKSYAGYRDIDLPSKITQVLGQKLNEKKPPIEISIPQFEYQFSALKKAKKLPYRFHDLRHYYASILVTLNVPDIYAMRLLGHSTINFLRQNYQHIMEKQFDKYREQIKQMI